MKIKFMLLPVVLLAAFFLFNGKVFSEPVQPVVDGTEASMETVKELETNLEDLSEDAVPIEEELEDEEVIDTDA